MILKSNAKINLSLKIIGKKENGYHLIDSVFLPIDLFDKIIVKKDKSISKILINNEACNFDNNICQKVIDYFEKEHHINDRYIFNIKKEIPSGAGLGGGSSNACEIFKFYNKKYKLNISNEEAIKVLAKLGADIPFFLYNKPSRIQGIGEIIMPLNLKRKFYILLVNPNINISTKDVYKTFDDLKIHDNDFSIDNTIEVLKKESIEGLSKYLHNDLELPAFKINKNIYNLKNELINLGLDNVLMTGSGSTVFAISLNKKELMPIYKRYKNSNYKCYLVKSKY